MNVMITCLIAVSALLGLVVGSFLTMVASRVPERKPVLAPPPYCVHCSHRLSWLDLIPLVSYFAQRGRCRYCREPISIRYPIVEALCAALFADMSWHLGYQPELLVALLTASLLLVSAVIDLKLRVIPNRITYFGLVAVAGLRIWIHPLPIWQYTLALVLGGGLFFLLAIVSNGGMGGGDIKLVALTGLFLGPGLLVMAILFSCLTGMLYGLGRLTLERGARKATIPFGPFIALGTWFAYEFGGLLLQGYR